MTVREVSRNIYDISHGPHRFICSYAGGAWVLFDQAQGYQDVYKTRARDWQAKVQAYIESNYEAANG